MRSMGVELAAVGLDESPERVAVAVLRRVQQLTLARGCYAAAGRRCSGVGSVVIASAATV
jgi:hypothetical protein